jgi:hypothetical protein
MPREVVSIRREHVEAFIEASCRGSSLPARRTATARSHGSKRQRQGCSACPAGLGCRWTLESGRSRAP